MLLLKKNSILTPQKRKLARKLAQESLVLIQNKNNILPLKKDAKVALIGPYANSQKLIGMWAIQKIL